MKRSIFALVFLMVLLTACTAVPEAAETTGLPTESAAAVQQPITENELGTVDGYD